MWGRILLRSSDLILWQFFDLGDCIFLVIQNLAVNFVFSLILPNPLFGLILLGKLDEFMCFARLIWLVKSIWIFWPTLLENIPL